MAQSSQRDIAIFTSFESRSPISPDQGDEIREILEDPSYFLVFSYFRQIVNQTLVSPSF